LAAIAQADYAVPKMQPAADRLTNIRRLPQFNRLILTQCHGPLADM
jgi:hypothetical protein